LSCATTTTKNNARAVGTTHLTSQTEEIKPCHGDPPTLPCHHVDTGR
jgi:hypothetical protein